MNKMESKEQRIERALSYLMELASRDSDPELLNAFHAISFLKQANEENSRSLSDCLEAMKSGGKEGVDLAIWVADTTLRQYATGLE